MSRASSHFDKGGERNGMIGIHVGVLGVEGIVVGIGGRGVAGNGGSVKTFWAVGKVGNVGFGKDGWVLGAWQRGSVGFSRIGCVGNVGKG